MDGSLLKIKTLRAWYNREKEVLSDFSLELAEHEAVGLIGLNGAGKTTFLKILSGLLPTFRADGIWFAGRPADVRDEGFKARRYTVFAEDNSFQYFTFREYLSYVFSVYGKLQPELSELIQGFGFGDYMDVLLKDLSTGSHR